MSRPRVLLLCGGQSEEHEVSLASARSVLTAAGDRLDLTPLLIDRRGRLHDAASTLRRLADGPSRDAIDANIDPGADPNADPGTALSGLPDDGFDVVFPLLHGPHGEDGRVQGMLDLMGLPYVGSGVLGSAVGMDKLMMKTVFAAHGFPQVGYRAVTRADWRRAPDAVLRRLTDLGCPLFVKPANLGSSVGITRVDDRGALGGALDAAFALDRRAIVEQGAGRVRELEVAVLGNDEPEASPVGEIAFAGAFYDYRTKYTEGEADLVVPARISADVAARCRRMAVAAFRAIDAAGLARVDFFFDEAADRLLLNEINTMPGFTTTSMYPRLWLAAGLDYGTLVERLVDLALEGR